MNTFDTANTIRDLIDYYCMRCEVGLDNCKISATECIRIRQDKDFLTATTAKKIAKATSNNYNISNSEVIVNLR